MLKGHEIVNSFWFVFGLFLLLLHEWQEVLVHQSYSQWVRARARACVCVVCVPLNSTWNDSSAVHLFILLERKGSVREVIIKTFPVRMACQRFGKPIEIYKIMRRTVSYAKRFFAFVFCTHDRTAQKIFFEKKKGKKKLRWPRSAPGFVSLSALWPASLLRMKNEVLHNIEHDGRGGAAQILFL